MWHERGGRSSSVLGRIRNFDLFPKTLSEVKETSKNGGLVTVISVVIVVALIFSEFSAYYTNERVSTVDVDNYDSGRVLPIRLRMAFSGISCDLVEFDVSDMLTGTENAVEKGLVKKPLMTKTIEQDGRFNMFLAGQRESNWLRLVREAEKVKIDPTRCLSCYDGTSECCNTCQELRVHMSRRGGDPNDASNYPQCQDIEGCLVSGTLMVGKTRGNFHVGVGGSHVEKGQAHHHHWSQGDRKAGFNISHYISELRIGEFKFRGQSAPLDSTGFYQQTAAEQVQYFLQVVPVDYHTGNGVKQTFEYTAARHVTRIDVNKPTRLPGVFFKYDVDAMKIVNRPKEKPLLGFFTRLVGVVGGVWVVLGMVFGGVVKLADAAKKNE